MFEDLFSKWDCDNKAALSAGELLNMIRGHRLAADPFGVSVLIMSSGLYEMILI